jgi:hypothetical protein
MNMSISGSGLIPASFSLQLRNEGNEAVAISPHRAKKNRARLERDSQDIVTPDTRYLDILVWQTRPR